MGIQEVSGNAQEAKEIAARADSQRFGEARDGQAKGDVIVVDGHVSVSSIFTAGLNRLLSKESSVMQAVAIGELAEKKEEIAEAKKPAPYIYVFKAKGTEEENKIHYDKIMGALNSGQYSEVRVIVDAEDGLGEDLDFVVESANKEGAKVHLVMGMEAALMKGKLSA